MTRHCSAFDTNSELLIQRFKQGITLVKPGSTDGSSINSISSIYSLPALSYFLSCDKHHYVDLNEAFGELSGLQSRSDVIGKTATFLSSPDLAAQANANHNTVITHEKMIVAEECGARFDDYPIHVLSFKFPWYYKNKMIGLFAFSIPATEMSKIAETMSQLISTGLLSPAQLLPMTMFPNKHSDVYLSKRENVIASHLIRGKNAREISHCLSISKRTVEHHIENIKLKLNVKSKSELIDKLLS